jgi:hypothetical protein
MSYYTESEAYCLVFMYVVSSGYKLYDITAQTSQIIQSSNSLLTGVPARRLIDHCHRDTEQSTIEAYITLDGVTMTYLLIR